MALPQRTWGGDRLALLPVALLAALGALGACAKIVGIEDTTVTRPDGSGGNENTSGSSSSAGAPHAGTSNAGHGNGGSSAAGATASAGSDSGAAGSGTAGAGGAVNQAGSTGNAGHAGQAGQAGSAGASECPCSAPTPTCENGKCLVRGPTMALTTSFYIDSTEVTKAQYDVFLAAKANGTDTSGQIPECSWNKSYVPEGDAIDKPRPIANVDWCDASAFCAWADKRLCGAIGGGAVAAADVTNPAKSQFFLACGGATGERYPYGGFALKADYCNAYFSGSMADVGSFEKCEGHYDGIFDLVGNAAEWLDSCDTTGGADHTLDNCQVVGGSYLSGSDSNCESHTGAARGVGADPFSFRCCSK